MTDKNSIHLQDFPLSNDYAIDKRLIDSMDKIRAICSTVLYVRDKNNLRVRLPLNKITIISDNNEDIKDFTNIILEETNIKNIEFLDDINNFGEKKLTLNFQKIGTKIGAKMPDVVKASKNGSWKIDKDRLKIDGFELEKDEFTINWISKKDNVFAVNNYDILIIVDMNITKELEYEGTARDIIRMIQQFRRDANLNISDRIELFLKTNSDFLRDSINNNKEYIKEQTLSIDLSIIKDNLNCEFSFCEDVGEYVLQIGFNRMN